MSAENAPGNQRPPAPSKQVLLLAHRGASAHAPENTLPALERALELRADGVEVDVQRTSDGVLVLVHDDDWGRTAGLVAPVRATPWAQVRHLDAGSWFGARFRGVRPARLDEALELVRGRMLLDLEIKSPHLDPGLPLAVAEAVRQRRMQEQVLVTSFDHDCIEALAECGDLQLGYLATSPVRRVHARVRTLALASDLVLARPDLVSEARTAKLRTLVWTVDDVATAARLVALGVDGILTNDPERLRAVLPHQA